MLPKQSGPLKFGWIGIMLFFVFLVGIISFGRILIRHEEKNKVQETLNKGNYLASLIAMQPIKNFDNDRRDFFMRTLTEYISSEGLIYCIIHDQTKRPLLSLASRDLLSKIPSQVKTKSLYTVGLTKQTFEINGLANRIYEFAKPIYEKGKKNRDGTPGIQDRSYRASIHGAH